MENPGLKFRVATACQRSPRLGVVPLQIPSFSVRDRVEALAAYQVMDTPSEEIFDEIARMASEVCDTPIAMISLLDDHRQWFKSRIGVEATETPIEHAFCAHAIRHPDQVMVVKDARDDARFRHNPNVVGGPLVRFYAGAPMVTPEGVPIGTVCAVDTAPRALNQAQYDMLVVLARQAVALLEAARWRAAFQVETQRCRLLEVSEAYFRHLTEYARDLISILEADGTIRFESRSIEHELGYSPEHYRGRNAFEFVHPDDRALVAEAFSEALQRHGNTPVIRFRFLHSDGSYRLLEGSGNNLLDDPAVRGIVFNSRDVTQHAELQQELEQGRLDKEETIARMTGGVAHDFNNVLAAIQGLAELTARQVGPASPVARNLAEIQEATGRAARLTNQLLAFSHRLVLEPRVLPLAAWLEELSPRLTAILGAGIELEIIARDEVRAWQDPGMLEQVILHLAVNAREAMPVHGFFSIQVSQVVLAPEERPADGRPGPEVFARIVIADDGSGMDPETLKRIFEPFFTTKPSENRHSGLGLSMCRGIIEQGGGHLSVFSEPGKGTVFHLFLPTPEAPLMELVARAPESQGPSRKSAPLQPTVLFVDDEPVLREIGQAILAEAGYRVMVAEDGPEALKMLNELGGQVDLLVTDVVMPGMTGVQLAEEVARRSPHTPALLCSGYTRDALALSGGLPSGVAFLGKPYALTSLLDKVGELLELPAAS